VHRRSDPGVPIFDIAVEVGATDEVTSPQLPGFTLAVSELLDR
jgi:hypothetical protein